jgi:hypothetical protein
VDIKKLLGLKPVIKRVVDTEQVPWSPTVVNINRMRAKAKKRKYIIIGAIIAMLVLCVACGAVSKVYTSQRAVAKPAGAAAPQLDMKRTPTPPPGWTVVPGQPGVSFKFATFTPEP